MRPSIPDAGCVTGRLQPLHLDHLDLFDMVLSRHMNLVVAITNPDPAALVPDPRHPCRHEPAANPFTFFERQEFAHAALSGAGIEPDRYRVVPFPLHDADVVHGYVPVHVVQYVRTFSTWETGKSEMLGGYGYRVELLEGDPDARISASDIRAALRSGGEWRHLVPAPVADLVERFLEHRPLADRGGP
jgi:nicotinamide mononucleotide adenylyltransferase